jgi:hypothetical protein
MIQTILKITKKLEENNIDYFLTGGTSLFIRNIIKNTKDIDISIKDEDFKKTKLLFKDEILFKFNKTRITFYKNNFEIELLLSNKEKDSIADEIFKNNRFETIKIKKQNINLIPLKDLLSMYRFVYLRDGKEKHLERIKIIEKLLKK